MELKLRDLFMKKIFLLAFLLNLFALPVYAAQEIDFKPRSRPVLNIIQDYPVVYKPTKFYIGKETGFIIQAQAGSNVALFVSDTNDGASLFYGNKLRLGSDMKTQEGIVPENGILEMTVNLPDDKNLDGKIIYFEVAVWKDESYNDLKIAKILASNGRETDSNAIQAYLPVGNLSRPSFMPVLPGAPPELYDTVKNLHNDKKDESGVIDDKNLDYGKNNGNFYQTPVMLRNLHSPDVSK